MARTTPVPEDRARAQVEALYGGPVPDVTWAWLVREQYIAEFEDGLIGPDVVVAKLRELNAVAPAAITKVTRRVGPTDPEHVLADLNNRMNALAEAVAARASRNARVLQWRHRWLHDRLIEGAVVTEWIDDTYRSHLPKAWPADHGPRNASNFVGKFVGWPHQYVQLQWFDAVDRAVRVWCVPPRGPLADLADVAGRLAEQWDWNAALATNFVLTGETPARPGVRGLSYRTRRGFDDRHGPYDFMWVRASIDIEVTPEELASWWRGVRSELGIAGRKPIGPKSVRLALFAMCRETETTYRQDMEAWNAEVPAEWHFKDWRNYRSAAQKALHALNRAASDCVLP